MKIILGMRYLGVKYNIQPIKDFVDKWLELKQFNKSANYVMRALDSISLRKFLGENAIKVNVEKR